MVLEEGRTNGIGVWEVQGYKQLERSIRSAAKTGLRKQGYIDEDDIVIEEILVVGSYGAGMGVPGKSDLDVVVLVSYMGDSRSSDFSNAMEGIAGAINYEKESIISGFSEFTDLEAYVFPILERDQHLGEMSMHEPVEYYYNLTEDSKWSYY